MRGMKQNHLIEDVKVTEFLRYEKTLERRVGPHVNIGCDVVGVLLQRQSGREVHQRVGVQRLPACSRRAAQR